VKQDFFAVGVLRENIMDPVFAARGKVLDQSAEKVCTDAKLYEIQHGKLYKLSQR
jgi:hypothetical protein